MGMGLLAVCFVGACPAAKGVHREVRYSHKGCACDLLQKELCEAHLHRRAIAIAHQKQDTEDPEEEGHADDQASQEGGEFSIHCIGYLSLCRQEASEPRGIPCLPRLRPVRNRPQANDNGLITCRHFTCGVIFVAIVRIKYVNDRSGGGLSPRWG